jgi:hypothetical protein
VEVFNKRVKKKLLQSFDNDTTLSWETFLPALALNYNTSYHSTIATTPFELLSGEKVRLPSFPNEAIKKLRYGETSPAELFNLLQKSTKMAHQFAMENGENPKLNIDKDLSANKFQIGDKVLIANDFYLGKNPKLVPNYKGPAKIIDINETNAKIKISIKIKVLNVEKLKLILEEEKNDKDIELEDSNFNDTTFDDPITRLCTELIKYKDMVQLTLSILKKEVEIEDKIEAICDIPFEEKIEALCNIPFEDKIEAMCNIPFKDKIEAMCVIPFNQCVISDAEEKYVKNNPTNKNLIKKCNCEKFAKLCLKFKKL